MIPSRRQGGRQWYHVIPDTAVRNADAYRGREEDERRLLYVALTRSKKFLFCTSAPEAEKGQYSQVSPAVGEITGSEYVLTRDPAPKSPRRRLTPQPRHEEIQLTISFSELRYYFDCPYQFKLRFLYGFRPGASEELGFGKSLHDALAEIHRRAMEGVVLPTQEAPRLVRDHLHLPYAYQKLRDDMAQKAEAVLRRYLWDNRGRLPQTEFAEKTIELRLEDGLLVSGRIDLIRRLDTNETEIVDFKSNDRTQEEEVTRTQLHVYAMGYRQLTGRDADLVSVYNLDQGAKGTVREVVDESFIQETQTAIVQAGRAIGANNFCRPESCPGCDFTGICR